MTSSCGPDPEVRPIVPVESTAPEVAPRKPHGGVRNAIEWLAVVAAAILVALVISATSAQAFVIPSKSMESTLHVEDRVLVNKWSYRLHPIHRGDLVVFARPKDLVSNDKDLIKRVIGLPGDKVAFADGHVHIDGKQLSEPYLDKGTVTSNVAGWRYQCTSQAPCVVPAGQIWVMGDNRGDSEDSRYFGPIPQSSVVGRAMFRIWPPNRIGGL